MGDDESDSALCSLWYVPCLDGWIILWVDIWVEVVTCSTLHFCKGFEFRAEPSLMYICWGRGLALFFLILQIKPWDKVNSLCPSCGWHIWMGSEWEVWLLLGKPRC